MGKKIFVVFLLGIMLLVGAAATGRQTANQAAIASGPDMGGKIAYVRGGAIWVYSGGQSRQITAGPKDRSDKRDAYPSFSPDGTQIAYTRIDEGFSDLYTLDLDSPAKPTALTDHRPYVEVGQVEVPGVTDGYNTLALWANYPAWSPDGELIAFTSDVRTEYPNLRVVTPNHTPGDDTEALASPPNLDWSVQTVENPSWSPTGESVVVATYLTDGKVAQVWSYNTTTEVWAALTDAPEGAYDPAWSPDGEWIAFAMREDGRTNIYVISTDPQTWTDEYPTPIKLTDDGSSRSPSWAPGSNRLAYVGLQGASFELYASDFKVDANGTPSLSSPQRLTDGANIDAPSGLSWGP